MEDADGEAEDRLSEIAEVTASPGDLGSLAVAAMATSFGGVAQGREPD